MKLPIHTVAVVLVIFALETQCGVIDNIFGTVKNTSNALKQDVTNVWSYSKNFVGLKTPVDDRPEEEKRGLIGGAVHSTREKVHNFRNYFWNTDANAKDAGLLGNMYNRVKNNLSKIKGSLTGDNQTPRPLSDNEKLIQNTLDKLFFGNGTRHVHGEAFKESIKKLKMKLQEIRNKVKNGTETPVYHGEGMIDVRAAALNVEDSVNENTPGVNNDVYDAVEENLNKAKENTAKSYNNIINDADKALTSLANGVNHATEQQNVIRDKAFDSAAKENELLQNSYHQISADAQKVGSSVKNTVEDAKRLSY